MIDLHSHSTCSDGSESPPRVIELAAQAGCSSIALTDHDGLSGNAEAAERARELGIGFVPGCEVSCSFSPGSMHILCYFIEDASGPLQDELARLRIDRIERNQLVAERLAELGLPITLEEVQTKATGVVGRPHFAAVLLDKGIVSSINEAFDRFLGKGMPGYVGRAPVRVEQMIEFAKSSGGVAVLAHPLSLGIDASALRRELAALHDAGLAGVECYYASYDTATRDDLINLATRTELVATGGSDFHGTFKPGLQVGVGRGRPLGTRWHPRRAARPGEDDHD